MSQNPTFHSRKEAVLLVLVHLPYFPPAVLVKADRGVSVEPLSCSLKTAKKSKTTTKKVDLKPQFDTNEFASLVFNLL